jgi:uncharacterized protein YbjQ (UPF0145 family)
MQTQRVLITTTPTVAGYRIAAVYGEVFGVIVRSRGLAGNLMAGLRSLGGGEINEYTQLLEQTRNDAMARMSERAVAMGANAVVSMRFDSSAIGDIMSEIVAYGTAVGIVAETAAGTATAQE